MKIETFFTSFLAYTNLDNINNQKLIAYGYELKDLSVGTINSNVGAWQSDSLDLINYEVAKLADIIKEHVEKVAECWKLKNDKTYVSIDNLWININPKCGFNRPHVHPGATFSGVYYVKCETNGSGIVFQHPATNFQYHINPDTLIEYNEFVSATARYTPNEGDLYIFPAYLVHYVEPNRSNDDRISIAFNASIKLN
jgi:uncharacterized protein (TIGR02466 family)